MNINTSYRIKAKASKANKNQCYLYVEVTIYHNGIVDDTLAVSTGLAVDRDRWDKDKVKGKDLKSKMLNEKITEFKIKTQDLLNELKIRKIEEIQEFNEVNNNLKLRLTGKVQRGKVQEQISKLKTYTFESVLNHKLEHDALSEERIRQYKLILVHMNRHFRGNIPTMDKLTEKDMLDIKQYFIQRKLTHNTLATRLSYVSAVVKHAIKLKIFSVSPIPSKYTPAFIDGQRDILTEEECMLFINLPDESLSKTNQIAKYCLIVQMLRCKKMRALFWR